MKAKTHLPDALKNFEALPNSAHVRLNVVCGLYAISPATAWRWVNQKRLPKPVKLSPQVTAWTVGSLREALADK